MIRINRAKTWGGVARHAHRPRRGATIVLVALLLTILVIFAGFAIDFARMYAFKAQLKVLTDAAALSAAHDFQAGARDAAAPRAVALREGNRVDGFQLADITTADIEPGIFSTNFFSFAVAHLASATAVRATARYNAEYLFLKLLGANRRLLTESSVASMGSAKTACTKPFVLPYRAVLDQIGKQNEPITYWLTKEDIQALGSGTAPYVSLAFTDGGGAAGNYQWVVFNKDTVSNANTYLSNAISTCDVVNVGGFITGTTGNVVNSAAVKDGLKQLCRPPDRGFGGSPNKLNEYNNWLNNYTWDCHPDGKTAEPIDLLAPIGNHLGGTGSNAIYSVAYIGVFQMKSIQGNTFVGRMTVTDRPLGSGFLPRAGPVGSKDVRLVM